MPGGSHLADEHQQHPGKGSGPAAGSNNSGGGGKAALAAAHAAAQMGHAATAAAAGYTSAVSAPPGGGPTPKPYKPPPPVTRTISDTVSSTAKAVPDTITRSISNPKREIRRSEADKFKQAATNRLIEQTWKTDSEGKPVMETTKAPVLRKGKTEQEVARASDRLDAKLDEIRGQLPGRQFRKVKAVETYRLGQKFYKTNDKGKILQEKVKTPKLTVSPERYEKKVEDINRTARQIRQGTHGHPKNPLKHPEDNTPWVNEDKQWRMKAIRTVLKDKADDQTMGVIKQAAKEGDYEGLATIFDGDFGPDLSDDDRVILKSAVLAPDQRSFADTLQEQAKEAADPGWLAKGLGDAAGFLGNTFPGPGLKKLFEGTEDIESQTIDKLPGVLAASSERAPLVEAGILPKADLKKLYDSTLGGMDESPLQYGFELALRPGALTENYIAHNLNALGIGNFEDLPSMEEVALHGYNAKNAPTGADLNELVGLKPWTGLITDIVLDPLTYVGAGGILSKGAARAGTLEMAINRADASILKNAQYVKLLKDFKQTGRSEALESYLRQVAKDNKISTSGLNPINIQLRRTVNRALAGKGSVISPRGYQKFGKLKEGDKLLERYDIRDLDNLLKQIKTQTEKSPTVNRRGGVTGDRPMQVRFGGTGRVEGTAGHDIGSEVIRSQNLTQRLDPGVEFRINTPLGRRVAGVKIPGSGSDLVPLPKTLLRTGVHGPAAEQAVITKRREAEVGPVVQKYDAQIKALEEQRDRAITLKEPQEVEINLNRRINELTNERDMKVAEIEDRLSKGVGHAFSPRRHLTPKEYAEVVSNRKQAHALNRSALAQARREEQQGQEVMARAGLHELDPRQRARVTQYLNERHSLGGVISFGKGAPLGPLDDAEQHAVDTLDVLYKELGKSDVTTGTLQKRIEDYVTRVPAGRSAGSNPAELFEDPMGGTSVGSTAAFQHGRVITEAEGLGSRASAVRQIMEASTHPNAPRQLSLEEAEAHADRVFASGHMRSTMEGLLQRVERQGALTPEDMKNLTPLQREAFAYEGILIRQDDEGRRFAEIDPNTEPSLYSGKKGIFAVDDEGNIVIREGADKDISTITPGLFDAAPDPRRQKWAAAMEHTRRLDDLIAQAPEGRHVEDYKAQRAQIEEELKSYGFKAGELAAPVREAQEVAAQAVVKAENAQESLTAVEGDIAEAKSKTKVAEEEVKAAEEHLARLQKDTDYQRDLREQLAIDVESTIEYAKARKTLDGEDIGDTWLSWLPPPGAEEGRNGTVAKHTEEAPTQGYDANDVWKDGTERQDTYVIYDDHTGKAVGAIRLTYFDDRYEEALFAVASHARGKGYGKRLIRAIRKDIPDISKVLKIGSDEALTENGMAFRRAMLTGEMKEYNPALAEYLNWLGYKIDKAGRLKQPRAQLHAEAATMEAELQRVDDLYARKRAEYLAVLRSMPEHSPQWERANQEITNRLDAMAQIRADLAESAAGARNQLDNFDDLYGTNPQEVYFQERERVLNGEEPTMRPPDQAKPPRPPMSVKGAKNAIKGAKLRLAKAKKFEKKLNARRRGIITHFNKVTKLRDDAEAEFEKLAKDVDELAPYLKNTTKMQANYHVHTIASRNDAWAEHMASSRDARPLPELIPLRTDGLTPTYVSQSTLPDTRLPSFAYEDNPAIPAAQRVRQSATRAMYVNRTKAIDDAYGMSGERARSGVAHVTFSRDKSVMVSTADLVPQRVDGKLIGYEYTDGASHHILRPEQVYIEDGMIPMGRTADNGVATYYDPATGWEWQRLAPDIRHPMVQEIVKEVGPDRWWPTHILQDTINENAWAAGGERASGAAELFDQGMDSTLGKALSTMRFGVTQYFPAYHMRNLTSDALMSVQADTGVIFHPLANLQMLMLAGLRRHSGRVTLPGIEKELEPAEALFIMDQFGMTSSQHLAEFAHLSSSWKGKEPSKFWLSRWNPGPKGKLGRTIIDLGARREDMIRFMTFRQRMLRNGGDVADATWHSIRHHFDYADLSHRERTQIRNLFLFYTWYRKNIPLQFQQLISRPGFFAAVGHVYEDLPRGETPLNQDFSKIWSKLPDLSGEVNDLGLIPDYMINQLGALTVNWNGHTAAFATGAPWNDMALVSNLLTPDWRTSGRSIVSMANPVAGLAINYFYNTDPLTGAELKARTPVPGILDSILPGELPKDEYGRPTLPSWITTAINYLPFFGRASKYNIATTQVEDPGFMGDNTRGGLLGSALFGVNSMVFPNESQGKLYKQSWERRYRGMLGEYNFEDIEGHNNMSTIYKNQADRRSLNDLRREVKRAGVPRRVVESIEEGNPFYLPQEQRRKQNQRQRVARGEEKYIHPARHAKDKPEPESRDFSGDTTSGFNFDFSGKADNKGLDFGGTSESGFSFPEKPTEDQPSPHEIKQAKHDRKEFFAAPEPLGPRKPWETKAEYALKQAKQAADHALKVVQGQGTEGPGHVRLGLGKTADAVSGAVRDAGGVSRDQNRPRRTPNEPKTVSNTVRTPSVGRDGRMPGDIPFPKQGPAAAYDAVAKTNTVLHMLNTAKQKAPDVVPDKDVQLAKDGTAQQKAALKKAYNAVDRVLTMVNAPKDKQIVQLAKAYVQAYEEAQPSIDGKAYAKLGPDAPEMAAAAVKYGKENGVDPAILMSIGRIESGFGANTGPSSAGAQGNMQFMPATRDMIVDKYGVDAYASPTEAVEAASLLLKDAGYAQNPYDAIFSYNHADWYVNDVQNGAKEFSELNKADVGGGKATPIPRALKIQARTAIGKQGLQYLKEGGKIVNMKDAPKGHKLQTEELFYDLENKYYDTSSGGWVSGQFGDHSDHVHFASKDPISMMLVIKHAQDIGLLQPGSGENPLIDTIDAPAHTDASLSFHNMTEPLPDTPQANRLYKQVDGQGNEVGQAVDLAGDPELMTQMRDWIEQHMGKGVNPYAGAVKIKGTDMGVLPPPPPPSSAPSTGTTTGASTAPSVPTSTAPGGGMPATPSGSAGTQRGMLPKGLLSSGASELGRFSTRIGDFPNTTPEDYYGFTNPADNLEQAQADYGFSTTTTAPDIQAEIDALVTEDDRTRYGF